jgi:predicted RNase H-like HicB family nuclease
MRYTVVFEETPEGAFIVSVPALPGCVTQADSHDQARKNIRDAMDLYIEDCRAAGHAIPEETQ